MKENLRKHGISVLSASMFRGACLGVVVVSFSFSEAVFAGDNTTKPAPTSSTKTSPPASHVQTTPQNTVPSTGHGSAVISHSTFPKQPFPAINQTPSSGNSVAHSTPPLWPPLVTPRNNGPTFSPPPSFVPMNQNSANNGSQSTTTAKVGNNKPPASQGNRQTVAAKPVSVPPQIVNTAVSSVSLKPGQGYCTDFASAVFANEVKSLKVSAPASDMRLRGDASQMLQNAKNDGWLTKTGDPSAAAVGAMVTYTDPTPDANGPGHIGVVTALLKNSQGQVNGITIKEMNVGAKPAGEATSTFLKDYKTTDYGVETTKNKYFDSMDRVNSQGVTTLIFQGYIYPQRANQ